MSSPPSPLLPFNRTHRAFVALFAFSLLSLLCPYLPGHEGDNGLWAGWSWHIRTYGLRKAYGSGTNYLPLYQWFLWLYGRLVGNPDHIGLRIGYLRCFTLAFDFAGLWLAWKWMDKRVDGLLFLLFNLFNIAYIYNTIIWGQVDGIMATLVFASLYCAHRNKPVWSGVFFLLALNMKLQSIIFLPLWGLLFLSALLQGRRWIQLVYALLAMAIVQVLILLPFLLEPGAIKQVWTVVTHSVDLYPRVSMNAYNIWYWLCAGKPWDVTDSTSFVAGLSYKNAGLFHFCIGGFFALWPIIRSVWKGLKGLPTAIPRQTVWLSGALVSLLFFFFNTQMHERYCHPAFIFVAAWCFYSRDFWPYLLFSLAYFLNLEGVLQFLKLENYHTVIFHPKFVSGLFAVLIIYLYYRLYKRLLTAPQP